MSVYAGAARAVAKGALAEYWMTTRPADVVRPNYGDGPRARVSAERDAGPRGFAGTPWKMNGKTAALKTRFAKMGLTSALFIDGTVYPVHLAISNTWKIRCSSPHRSRQFGCLLCATGSPDRCR